MKPNEYLFQTFPVVLAGALAGCAASTPSPRADYTYCSRYGTVEKIDPTTGEILCLVHEGASYKTVERKELARAASKRYEDVPAEYATVTKTVLKKPETVQEVEVPAEYQTIKVRRLVKTSSPVKVAVAPEYATVNK